MLARAGLHVLCLAAWVLGTGAADSAAAGTGAPLRIETGLIRGKPDSTNRRVRAYLGIPFARPPVGELRWRPPQPARPWDGVRECATFGPACWQPAFSLFPTRGPFSEDCLYLNVWAPLGPASAKRPVMVWIHGGGFVTGSGSKPHYHGARLAARGVVVVTINYRLGPFGFFAHPSLSAESPRGVSSNYGLLDQIAALRWVKRNIAAFGGDPNNVTIFGESAGAMSVCCLLVSPLARGLFHRAIAESGVAVGLKQRLKERAGGQPSAEAVGKRIAARLGLSNAEQTAAALRAVPAEKLLKAANPKAGLFGKGTRMWPCIDGYVLPDEPEKLFRSGRFHPVPLILGVNADEGSVFVKGQLRPRRVFGYRLALRAFFGREGAKKVEAMYPAARDDEAAAQLSRVVTDSAFMAPTRRLARMLARAGRAPVYLYFFSRVSPAARFAGLGALHGAEIPYVFGWRRGRRGYNAADERLSEVMQAAWTRFARAGDPNGGDMPSWPAYSLKDEPYMEFGDEVKVGYRLRAAACDLFDELAAAGSSSRGAKAASPHQAETFRRAARRYEEPGPFKVDTLAFPDLKDASRSERSVPLKAHYAAAKEPFPLLVFSHGGMGDWDSHIYLARHMASHGYVAVCIEHVYSNGARARRIMAEARGGFRRRLNEALMRITTDPKSVLERPRDVSFAIDCALKWNETLPELKGKIRPDRIAVIGHSYGAYTVLTVCGARPILDYLNPPVAPGKGLGPDLSDSRVTVGVAMSPQGPGASRLGVESYKTIRRPLLCFSGTKDQQFGSDGRMQPASRRLDAFRLMPPGDKFMLWLENADHMAFAFNPKARLFPSEARSDAKRIVTVMTLAFCDAYLKDDADARRLLDARFAESLRGNVVTRVTWRSK